MENKVFLSNNSVKSTLFGNVGRYRGFFIRFAIVLFAILVFCRIFEDHLRSQIQTWKPVLSCPIYPKIECPISPKIECPKAETPTCPAPNCKQSVCPTVEEKKKFKFEDFACFQSKKNNATTITLLEDVMDSNRKPGPDSIFFLETSCNKDGLVHLTPRQLCSIESAALTNPNRDIFVLFVAPVGRASDASLESKLIPIVQKYSNIFLRTMNFPKLVKDTPIEEWFHTGKLFTSRFIQVHTSDFLRLLTIYKFGGTYFDLDFVILKNLDKLEPNFFCTESDRAQWRTIIDIGRTGNSVVNFARDGVGHDYASLILQEFAWKFNGQDWSSNGPNLLRRVAERTCQTKNHFNFTRETCGAFEVYPYYYFYPVHEIDDWDKIYKDKDLAFIQNKTKDSFAVHTWDSQAKAMSAKTNEPNSAYSYWMKNFCPKMFEVTGTDLFGTY